MDYTFFTAPSQMNLINDFIFDLSGVPVSANELVIGTIGVIAAKMILNAPFFNRA